VYKERGIKLNPFPPVPKTVFHAFRFPDLGFDIHFVPHNGAAAAALRRKARINQMTLADYLHEELLGELAP
jgi:hypothetical protein